VFDVHRQTQNQCLLKCLKRLKKIAYSSSFWQDSDDESAHKRDPSPFKMFNKHLFLFFFFVKFKLWFIHDFESLVITIDEKYFFSERYLSALFLCTVYINIPAIACFFFKNKHNLKCRITSTS
jgi:hypothetical protein